LCQNAYAGNGQSSLTYQPMSSGNYGVTVVDDTYYPTSTMSMNSTQQSQCLLTNGSSCGQTTSNYYNIPTGSVCLSDCCGYFDDSSWDRRCQDKDGIFFDRPWGSSITYERDFAKEGKANTSYKLCAYAT
jgi:hypothetical protein